MVFFTQFGHRVGGWVLRQFSALKNQESNVPKLIFFMSTQEYQIYHVKHCLDAVCVCVCVFRLVGHCMQGVAIRALVHKLLSTSTIQTSKIPEVPFFFQIL